MNVEHTATITNHHVDDHTETAFEQFRTNFPYVNCHVQEGYMNYIIKRTDHAGSIEREAKEIISRLQLSLKTSLKYRKYDALLTSKRMGLHGFDFETEQKIKNQICA